MTFINVFMTVTFVLIVFSSISTEITLGLSNVSRWLYKMVVPLEISWKTTFTTHFAWMASIHLPFHLPQVSWIGSMGNFKMQIFFPPQGSCIPNTTILLSACWHSSVSLLLPSSLSLLSFFIIKVVKKISKIKIFIMVIM